MTATNDDLEKLARTLLEALGGRVGTRPGVPTVQQVERLVARNREAARRAIGKATTVRLTRATRTQSGSTVSGIIEKAEAAGVRRAGGSIVAQVQIWLRTPDNRLVGPYLVEELPR
jgi:hypothetical protein